MLYYYFADLDELLVATAEYPSAEREARYPRVFSASASAAVLIQRLRVLYLQDLGPDIEAVKELIAAARPATALATMMATQTKRWEGLAEQVLRTVLRGSPLARG